MESANEDIIVVGGGIAGLSTALGLHRLGLKCLVLESSDKLRITGAAFTTWTNAWKALDVLGIGNILRQQHHRNLGMVATSTVSPNKTSEILFSAKGSNGKDHEVGCVKRRILLETLAAEVPSGTIRYSSKLVAIEESGHFKVLHLADGSILKAKVLIGCDGVSSAVSKYLGFKKLSNPAGRCVIRGYIQYKENHGYEPKFLQFMGHGVRYGIVPCDSTSIYWFFTFTPSGQDKELEQDPVKMKQFVLSKLGNVPDKIRSVIEETKLEEFIYSPLRFRKPWDVLFGNISKDNVCVLGDAFHPMTPDLGQGACSAIEDAVVLARCLGKAFSEKDSLKREEIRPLTEEDEYERIKKGLKNYADERRWRGIDLISTSYCLGYVLQSDNTVIRFLREKLLAPYFISFYLRKADFDCGDLKG